MTDMQAKEVCLRSVDKARESETAWDALIAVLQLLGTTRRDRVTPAARAYHEALKTCHYAVERVRSVQAGVPT